MLKFSVRCKSSVFWILVMFLAVLSAGSASGQQDLEEPQGEASQVQLSWAHNPFYYSGLREHMLSYMGQDELRAFEKVDRSCRTDAYKVDRKRWISRWQKVGLHIINDLSPQFYNRFDVGAEFFRVQDYFLTGRSKRMMNWKRALRFCKELSPIVSRELNHLMSCEILDNSQWLTLVKASMSSTGQYHPKWLPQMRGRFWSKTPVGTSGVLQSVFDGDAGVFEAGFLLPRLLFLLKAKDVHFYARCACK